MIIDGRSSHHGFVAYGKYENGSRCYYVCHTHGPNLPVLGNYISHAVSYFYEICVVCQY